MSSYVFKFKNEVELEDYAERLAEKFKVKEGQMPLSRDEKDTLTDIFFTALYEIRSRSIYDNERDKFYTNSSFEVIQNFAEDVARRIIGDERANYFDNVFCPIEHTLQEWQKECLDKDKEM